MDRDLSCDAMTYVHVTGLGYIDMYMYLLRLIWQHISDIGWQSGHNRPYA